MFYIVWRVVCHFILHTPELYQLEQGFTSNVVENTALIFGLFRNDVIYIEAERI